MAALLAALCWTVATLLWRRLPSAWTAQQLNLRKTLLAFLLQLPLLALVRWPPAFQGEALWLLALSGVVGIAWGDSLFFGALRRLGTRRSLTLSAGGPALTALVGLVTLGERPRVAQWLGIGLISLSVVVVTRQRSADASASERAAPATVPWAGLGLALAAMACGSAGALLARMALRSGEVPALVAATVRLGAASLILLPVGARLRLRLARRPLSPLPSSRAWPLPWPLASLSSLERWRTVLVATLLGTSLGIMLQQLALKGLSGGLAVALLSTSPVLALPFARLEGDRPGLSGWLAALAACAGVSLVAGLTLPGAGWPPGG
ncbi:MAG: DMT family transporter [Cyanobacteria bacterium K_Offshore_surface_m2_239]|nr:DMT family transporter [Cyanobacteria bacterium K_Offshore_surface_m2_239]